MRGIFLYPDMRNIALAKLSIGVDFAEAGLDDAPFLIFEAFRARHAGRRWPLLALRHVRCTQARLRVQSAVGARHIQSRIGAIAAHVAVAVGRRARHGGRNRW